MAHFSGQLHPGPFSVLLNQLELLSWHLHDPPFVSDHTGHQFDFLSLAEDQLWTKAVHGWHLRLSRTLARRKDINGLLGLDWRPTQLALQSLPPLALASMQALVEGSFMTGRSQAKFDLAKDGSCSFCPGPDTIEHWCLHCPRLQPVLHRHADIRRRWHALPQCMTEHLLCPANPFHQQLLHQLWLQPPTALRAHTSALPSHLDFFTDGSCYQPHHPMLALAGWAASLAFTDFDLAGPLIGHPQTISRAELTAVLQVLRWSNVHAIASPISIWTDSAYVASGVNALLHGLDHEPGANCDLWADLENALSVHEATIQIQHVAAHGDSMVSLNPVSDWIVNHNNRVDLLAKQAAWQRNMQFLQSHSQYHLHDRQVCQDIKALVSLHVDVASARAQLTATPLELDHELETESTPQCVIPWLQDSYWLDDLPIAWSSLLQESPIMAPFDPPFFLTLMQWLQSIDTVGAGLAAVSWIELAFLVKQANFAPLPVPAPGLQERWNNGSSRHHGMTLASCVRYLQRGFRAAMRVWNAPMPSVTLVHLAPIGIHMPVKGLHLRLAEHHLVQVHHLISAFTATRRIRSTNDLSRPF